MSPIYSQDCCSQSRKNTYVDSIQFIKAGPASTACETFKEFDETFVIQGLWACENEAHFTKTLCQLFRGLSFSSSHRALQLRAITVVQRHEHSSEASIGERRNDQPI